VEQLALKSSAAQASQPQATEPFLAHQPRHTPAAQGQKMTFMQQSLLKRLDRLVNPLDHYP